jgi:hypothetical protein|uniref:Uncharacterized protein n=1 Tax=Siphoviridae sp. ctOCb13 TaxID=2825477 RepID=A0A8S5Q1H6_9CAUD|nr:MAG TPA: hypothetical protein [Siphoviridae sp. ctOCb13]
MDYKVTILKKEIPTEETLLPEISDLHFGILAENKAVFDYTAYIEANKLQIDYKVFMRMNKHFIEILAKASGKKTFELFFQNTNGHILVEAELAFIFLAFVNPDMFLYFNGLLTDAISDGVAYSHSYIYSLAAQRLPSEVLNDIIKERKNDTAGDQQ